MSQPDVPPRHGDLEGDDLDGFQPARRSTVKHKSGQPVSKAWGSRESTVASKAVLVIEGGLKTAQSANDWLTLWRLWILQVSATASRHEQASSL